MHARDPWSQRISVRASVPFALLLSLMCGIATLHGAVVINEILYHAPDDLDDLQFIELHNPGPDPVDIGGWSFTKGIQFRFPAGSTIERDGYLVLCRNAERFREFYQVPVAGVFESVIRRKGERIELSDATGTVVDGVKFDDKAPWPTGADGYSGSLERIVPGVSGDRPSNWVSSPLSENRDRPAGTPGRRNAGYSATLPPEVGEVVMKPEFPGPGEPLEVEAVVADSAKVTAAHALYRVALNGVEGPETEVAMKPAPSGRWVATLPGQAMDSLIRVRVRVTGADGSVRMAPAPTEPRPALSAYVQSVPEPAKVPFAWIVLTTPQEHEQGRQRAGFAGARGFGGFGPGGFRRDEEPPDPLVMVRTVAFSFLERELDLSVPWFEWTVLAPGRDEALPKLKAFVLAKLEERDRFMHAAVGPGKTEADMQPRPELSRPFLTAFATEASQWLEGHQLERLRRWAMQPGGEPGSGFRQMIFGLVDLEGAWHAISLNADVEAARLPALREVLRGLHSERLVLVDRFATGRGRETAFREERKQADALGERVVPALDPHLNEAQRRQLAIWKEGPRSRVVGSRGGKAATPEPARVVRSDGPPGGFAGGGRFRGGPFGRSPTVPGTHLSAFVYYDPSTGKRELFDFVEVSARKGGQKVHFQKDRTFQGMTSLNLIFEGETAALVEPLAYEVYRRAGMAAERSFHVRLWQAGRPMGYQVLIEQPNGAFLRRNGLRDDGNLYKYLWFERDLVGQHEKKTNRHEGHDDILGVIDALRKTPAEGQWALIEKEFDVDQVATYFAVNTVLSHWDGFFNNFFAYHDVHGSGKWMMFPWDQDNTWGVMGMRGDGDVFHTMPLTFGMNGDLPPGGGGGGRRFGGFGGWWREPGWFSGPLLANPEFRKRFLVRTREILETTYTEAVFGPILDAWKEKLEPEVRVRAEILNRDPDRAVAELSQRLERCREHLRLRRAFLLQQEEIRKVSAGR